MKVMECCTKKKATGLHSRGRYGGGFQVEVDAPAEPPDSQITMDAMTKMRLHPRSV